MIVTYAESEIVYHVTFYGVNDVQFCLLTNRGFHLLPLILPRPNGNINVHVISVPRSNGAATVLRGLVERLLSPGARLAVRTAYHGEAHVFCSWPPLDVS